MKADAPREAEPAGEPLQRRPAGPVAIDVEPVLPPAPRERPDREIDALVVDQPPGAQEVRIGALVRHPRQGAEPVADARVDDVEHLLVAASGDPERGPRALVARDQHRARPALVGKHPAEEPLGRHVQALAQPVLQGHPAAECRRIIDVSGQGPQHHLEPRRRQADRDRRDRADIMQDVPPGAGAGAEQGPPDPPVKIEVEQRPQDHGPPDQHLHRIVLDDEVAVLVECALDLVPAPAMRDDQEIVSAALQMLRVLVGLDRLAAGIQAEIRRDQDDSPGHPTARSVHEKVLYDDVPGRRGARRRATLFPAVPNAIPASPCDLVIHTPISKRMYPAGVNCSETIPCDH